MNGPLFLDNNTAKGKGACVGASLSPTTTQTPTTRIPLPALGFVTVFIRLGCADGFLGRSKYTKMTAHESEHRMQYLRDNNVHILFEQLAGKLMRNKPDKPVPFLIEHLKEMKAEQSKASPVTDCHQLEAATNRLETGNAGPHHLCRQANGTCPHYINRQKVIRNHQVKSSTGFVGLKNQVWRPACEGRGR